MKNKRLWLGLLAMTFVFCCTLTSCWSTGTARETIPRTAVTLQRVRSTIMPDLPMQIFVDDNPHELANGATTTILVNNGDHMVYAVLGDVESRSIRFTAKSQTITINAAPRERLLLGTELTIEVK